MPVKRESESEMSVASRDLERYQNMTERERLEYNMSGNIHIIISRSFNIFIF